MKEIKVMVYEYDELGDKEKMRAVNDHITFLLQFDPEDTYFMDSIEKAEALRTPWFIGEIMWEDHRIEIEEELRQYTYLKDGSISPHDEE